MWEDLPKLGDGNFTDMVFSLGIDAGVSDNDLLIG